MTICVFTVCHRLFEWWKQTIPTWWHGVLFSLTQNLWASWHQLESLRCVQVQLFDCEAIQQSATSSLISIRCSSIFRCHIQLLLVKTKHFLWCCFMKLNRVCNRISGATLLARFLFSTARIETSMSLVEDTPWSRKLSLGGNATILPTQNRVEPGLADVMGQTAIEVRVWGLQMLVLLALVYGITGIWAPHILYLSLFILSWTPSLWIIFHCLCLLTLFYTVPLCILFIIYFILFI